MGNRWVLISGCLLAASCSVEPQLVSDADAERLEATRTAARAQTGGVKVFIEADAWRGRPVALSEVVTPVRISVENSSGRPLRIAYADFTLRGQKQYHALAVLERDETPLSMGSMAVVLTGTAEAERPLIAPRFGSRGFFIAPFYQRQFPRYEPWPRSLDRDPALSVERPRLRANLPSRDMVAEGVPEGVVESGGFVSGFVFFDRVEPGEKRVVFDLALTDPDTAERWGDVRIPFAPR